MKKKIKFLVAFVIAFSLVGSSGALYVTLLLLYVFGGCYFILHRSVERIMWPIPKSEFQNHDKNPANED